jgi:ribosomal protein L7/L12
VEPNNYIQTYNDYFWCWEDEGEVVGIPGGETIAYREFVWQIMEALADQGLPPFGSLLLAIVATNYSTKNPLLQVEEIIRKNIPVYHAKDQFHPTEEVLGQAMQFLRMLSALPMKYTTGDKRVQLFQLIFAGAHNSLSSTTSRDALAGQWSPVKEYSYETFYTEFRCIALLLKRFPDAASLIEKLAGIPEIEEPVELEEEGTPVPGDFIQSLVENYKTFSIGALIRYIWSGLNIPIHHTLPSSQPLGGVSDLSNKGDFDKLLVSEFANDDWLFLSRVANQEALYLHREMPPAADDLERVILLDISLKSWGTPKVLAYAILLAIARHPRTDIPCTALAVGNSFYPLAFATVDELINSIQLLDGALHPAAGLTKFFEQHPAPKKAELLFIASPETMRHPDVQKVFSDHYQLFKYWVHVGQEGEIELFRNQHGGKKLVQQIRLPLEQLWEEAKKKIRIQPEADSDMERISAMQVPILFPLTTSKIILVSEDGAIFAVTKDGKWFRQQKKVDAAKGWELLLTGIAPSVTHYEIGSDGNGHPLLLCFTAHDRQVIIYQSKAGFKKTKFFDHWGTSYYKDFFFRDGDFYYKTPHDLWKISWGSEINIEKVPSLKENTFIDFYQSRQARIEKGSYGVLFSSPVLKNINRVFISQEGRLIFNKHELVLLYGIIKFEPGSAAAHREGAIDAEWNRRDTFTFRNGSTITVDRSGMLILQDSPKAGAASFDVVIRSCGERKLSVIKTIIDHGENPGLRAVTDLVTHAPAVVKEGLEIVAANRLRDQLTNSGAQAEVVINQSAVYIPSALECSLGVATDSQFTGNSYYYPSEERRFLTKVDPVVFFDKKIRTFIQRIMEYETDH